MNLGSKVGQKPVVVRKTEKLGERESKAPFPSEGKGKDDDDDYLPLRITLNKKITQTAVINTVFQRIFIKLDVSYASQHTFSKVTVTIFENYIYIYRKQVTMA